MADPDRDPGWLCHFSLISYTEAYWELGATEREAHNAELERRLAGTGAGVHTYRVFPTRCPGDILLWLSVRYSGPDAMAELSSAFLSAVEPSRRTARFDEVYWGYTRSSEYVSKRSPLEIDPASGERLRYLVVYPFSKTAEWYLLDQKTRREMMGEHIRIGRQHRVRQLLLYSFGLQDQEFVVAYETEDLRLFSDLVRDLRETQARSYTLRDTPVITGVLTP